jgi:hypothetical protein
MYDRAMAAYKKDRFRDLKSGETLYNWLSRMKKETKMLDTFLKEGGSRESFDAQQHETTRSVTSDELNMLTPLFEAFDNRFQRRRSNTVAGTQAGAPSGRRLFSSGQAMMGVPNVDEFETSGIVISRDRLCTHPKNQSLYSGLIDLAQYRLVVMGAIRRNRGHFQTGKKWYSVAKQILLVSSTFGVAATMPPCMHHHSNPL